MDAKAFPVPETYQDCVDALDVLMAGGHPYKTLVVDTADWMDDLIRDLVVKQNGWSGFTQDYAEGEKKAAEIWRAFTRKLDRLRDVTRMEIIVLAHAHVADFTPPNLSKKYMRFEAKLEKRVRPVLQEWADVHLFAHWEEWEDGKTASSKRAKTSGARLLHSVRSMAWDAKNRWDMPATIPLSYEDFDAHRSVAREELRSGKDVLTEKAMELYDELKPEGKQAEIIKAHITKCSGNKRQLRACITRLEQLIDQKEPEKEEAVNA